MAILPEMLILLPWELGGTNKPTDKHTTALIIDSLGQEVIIKFLPDLHFFSQQIHFVIIIFLTFLCFDKLVNIIYVP